MNKKLFSLLLLVALSSTAFSQFHFGPKIGANVAKVNGKSFKDEFSYGYHAGVFMQLKLSKKFSIQPEILFSEFNTKLDSSYNNIYQISLRNLPSVKLDYFTVPVLLNYKLGNGFLTLQAGPQFGILFDAHSSVAQNAETAFKKGDLSMLGGVQVKVGSLRLNGRYFVGLNDLKDVVDNSKWKNQGFQVSLGLAIL